MARTATGTSAQTQRVDREREVASGQPCPECTSAGGIVAATAGAASAPRTERPPRETLKQTLALRPELCSGTELKGTAKGTLALAGLQPCARQSASLPSWTEAGPPLCF